MSSSITSGVGIEKLGTVTVFVSDQDKARTFFTEAMGFDVRADMPMAPGNNWLTVAHPAQPPRSCCFTTTSRPARAT